MTWASNDVEGELEYIEHSFGFHPGNPDVAPKYEKIRAAFKELATILAETCPIGSAQYSYAIQALEVAQMQAIKSVALMTPLGPETRRTS